MNAAKINVAIYARISSNSRIDTDITPEKQEARCREELDHRFGRGEYRAVVYRENAAGVCDPDEQWRVQRPALARMQAAFKEGAHQTLCVWDVSRLARFADLADFLDEHFRPNGLREVISCH